jgi:hypothetical protein
LFLVLCAALFSFSKRTGGDTFAIYLNNKVLLEERVLPEAAVKSLTLSPGDFNGTLKVHYSHCGQIGINRSLSIKDSDNKVLKTWDFRDSSSPLIDVDVKELYALKNDPRNQRFQLLYSSKEIPKGKVLAAIILPDDTKASRE